MDRNEFSSTVLPTPRSPVSTMLRSGAAAGYPLQHHFELAKLAVTARQFRRPLACAGRIRIPDRVHVSNLMARSSKFPRLT